MVFKHSMTRGKRSCLIINFPLYRNVIFNYHKAEGIEEAKINITSSPEVAFYEKQGKVLHALQTAYEKHKQQRRTGCLLIQQFFKSYATLKQDLLQAYQWCLSDLPLIKSTDWENDVLGLF